MLYYQKYIKLYKKYIQKKLIKEVFANAKTIVRLRARKE